jgi:hypothetical protein
MRAKGAVLYHLRQVLSVALQRGLSRSVQAYGARVARAAYDLPVRVPGAGAAAQLEPERQREGGAVDFGAVWTERGWSAAQVAQPAG